MMPPILSAGVEGGGGSVAVAAPGVVDYDIIAWDSGTITLPTVGVLTDVPSLGDITIDAAEGDIVGFALNVIAFGGQTFLVAATIVGGVNVRTFPSGGWFHSADDSINGSSINGEKKITIQPGDLVAGTVTLRLEYVSIGTNGTLGDNFSIEATNYGPIT